MNDETILNFIKKGESETVEFKSTLDQAAIETLAAFANTKGGYVFAIRNKQIATLFKEAGIIEKYGSGIKRVLESIKSYGLKEPSFEEIQDGFLRMGTS